MDPANLKPSRDPDQTQLSGPASVSSPEPARSKPPTDRSVGVSGAYSVGDTVIFRDPSLRRYGRMRVLTIKPFPGKEAEGDKAWVHFEHGAVGVNAIYPVADLIKLSKREEHDAGFHTRWDNDCPACAQRLVES